MSSVAHPELIVAEGLLAALDTSRGLETARKLLNDDDLDEAAARERLEEMLRPRCEGCGEAKAAGATCPSCGLAEADTSADYPTDIGQDMNFPKRVARRKRHRKKKAKKVEEATNVGGTAAVPSSGTATPWGGVNPAVASLPVGGRGSGRQRDRDFQPSGAAGQTLAVLTPGASFMSPPNLRDADGWESCQNCVFFNKQLCNLYGWDRDGTPGEADMVHRAGFPVDRGDLCDAHTTLTPDAQRLEESLDRADYQLAEAALAENTQMIVRARARVRRAEELLSAALDVQIEETWGPEARAAALLARRSGRHAPKAGPWVSHADAFGPSGPHTEGGVTRKADKFGTELVQRSKGESALHYAMRRLRDKPANVSDAGAALYKVPKEAKYGGNHKVPAHALMHAESREHLREVSSDAYPGLDRSPKKNWVDKAGGLPRYIERIAKHLHYEKGKDIGTAIAIAVNVVKKMCASGDTNFPGKQNVNPKSRAQACAAVADWEAKKAKSKGKTALKHAGPWESFPAALVLVEAAFKPIPPSDRFIETLLGELLIAEGADWYEGLDVLDEADGLLERYADHLDEMGVTLDESKAVTLMSHAGKSLGHWNPLKHPRAPKGRTGGGEFSRTDAVLSKLEKRAQLGSRDRQRGYRHPAGALPHERFVAEMFDRVAGSQSDRSIFPAERRTLGSYLRKGGHAKLASKVETGRGRMLTSQDSSEIAAAIRSVKMPAFGGKTTPHEPLSADKLKPPKWAEGGFAGTPGRENQATSVHPDQIKISGADTWAHEAKSVEDAFKKDNAKHAAGRKNEGALTVDHAISQVLQGFAGLEDWHVEKVGDNYHVHVDMGKKGKHEIQVSPDGKTKYLTSNSKLSTKPKLTPAAKKELPAEKFSSPALHAAEIGELEPTGESEKPYHMPDGAFFMGKDDTLYQKLESGPKLMMGKKGPLAGVRIHNHKTGTQKVAPAFALGTYYDILAPKGHGKKATPAAPSHGDIESQLKASIGGQKAVSQDAGWHNAAPSGGAAEQGGMVDVAGKHVVITGKIPGMAREEAHARLKVAGAFVHSSVSKDVHYLITGEDVGKKKPEDAMKKGAKVIPHTSVLALLEELDPLAEAELARLYGVAAALEEATSTAEIVRLRARRSHLLNGLGLEEREFSTEERKKAASKGNALDDGSFPIENTSDLKNAIRAVGRAAPGKRAKVRAHIRKHAKRLGAESALPEGW